MFFVISILANYSTNEAHACSCMAPESPTKELEKFQAVFLGKVINIEETRPSEPLYSSMDPVLVAFDVDKIWKGLESIENSTVVISTAVSSASCGFYFEENLEYVVYAHQYAKDDQLEVSLCSRTNLALNAAEDILELDSGDTKKPESNPVLLSPLKQFKANIPIEKIQCRDNLELIIKYDNTPACVKAESAAKLIERGGWTSIVVTQDTKFEETNSEKDPQNYLAFENGVTEIINPDHESMKYYDTSQQIIKDTYLLKNAQQWTDATQFDLESGYEIYGDDFYTELGRLLMKNEMQFQMNELGIVNSEDDFEVISGMMLTSLPPHIGFSSIVHGTDSHYYWLQGMTQANQVNYYRTSQLQYPNPTETASITGDNSPEVIPQISILLKGGEDNDLKSIPAFTTLEQPGEVEFYNDTPGTLTVYLNKDGVEEFSFETSQKIIVQSKSDKVWEFTEPGSYSWHAKVPAIIEDREYELNTGGGILVLSDDMSHLSKEEKIDTARMMIISASGLPISGIGQHGEEDTLFISLSPAIDKLLPESREYYLKMAQELVPFEDITIKLD